MSTKHAALAQLNRLFGLVNAEVTSKAELGILRDLRSRFGGPPDSSSDSKAALPLNVIDYLRADNARLLDLRARYREVDLAMIVHSKWNDELVAAEIELPLFRGDNAYIFQRRDFNTISDYLLTAYFLKLVDKLGLFDLLSEDGLFGAWAMRFNNDCLISRDLLDSIAEINFLEETLQISNLDRLRVLDIGAGYGRLAHRLTTAFPNTVEVFCVDAVAESTFVSEFYLQFRGVDDRARVVPLDEIERLLSLQTMDLATNIHSFSECTLAAIRGWLDLVRRHDVRYLMIVPNAEDNGGTRLTSFEQDGRRFQYLREITTRGYRLKAMRPKFAATSVQEHGVSPTHYYLFELRQ